MIRKTIIKRIELIIQEVKENRQFTCKFGTQNSNIAFSLTFITDASYSDKWCRFILRDGKSFPNEITESMISNADYIVNKRDEVDELNGNHNTTTD